MGIEWHKEQYEIKMAALEAKYKKFAEIWHAKGRKALNHAIHKQELRDWNDVFEEEWAKFTILKLRCPECHYVKEFKLDLERELDIRKNLNQYINLICTTCKRLIDIDKWEVIE